MRVAKTEVKIVLHVVFKHIHKEKFGLLFVFLLAKF